MSAAHALIEMAAESSSTTPRDSPPTLMCASNGPSARFRSMNASPAARTMSALRGGRLISFSSGGLSLRDGESKEPRWVEALYREVHVKQSVFQIFMTEQDLNGAEIRASLVEMRRKTVAKQMGIHAFLEAGALGGFLTCEPNGFSYRSADRLR